MFHVTNVQGNVVLSMLEYTGMLFLYYCTNPALGLSVMSIIVTPWSVCKGCYKMSGWWPEKDGDDGPGVNTDFILYVSAKNTSTCGGQTIAYSSYCQLERALDRYIRSIVYTNTQACIIIIYPIMCLKSGHVRRMQFAMMAQSPREMSQTDRIHPRYFLSRVRVSIRPRIFLYAKKPQTIVARILRSALRR